LVKSRQLALVPARRGEETSYGF